MPVRAPNAGAGMCLDRGAVVHRSARDPNWKRVARMRIPKKFRISPGDVGGRCRLSNLADVSFVTRVSWSWENTAKK